MTSLTKHPKPKKLFIADSDLPSLLSA